MLDYRLWQQRLIDELDGTVKTVGFSADIKAVFENATKIVPAIYIIPSTELSSDRDSTASTGSYTTGSIDVLVAARDYSDALGSKALDTNYEVTKAVFKALNGWTPPDADCPIHKRSGKRIMFKDSILYYAVNYDCKYFES